MSKINIGIMCPSEIAYRRFMPALKKCGNFKFAGIAIADSNEWNGTFTSEMQLTEIQKAKRITDEYGGRIFKSYMELICDKNINAVYVPLPPALHYKWGKFALANEKHILMEKPFTISEKDTRGLIEIAKNKNLAVHENYMFVYHSQIEWIKNKIAEGAIGEIRLIRIDFGFPFRGTEDFRYNKDLGGGSLLDCGGYTLKLASLILGDTTYISDSQLNFKNKFDVDIYGSATLKNNDGLTAQISFGMDNSYKCSLEVWGSKGSIYANRILTAPDNFEPEIILKTGNDKRVIKLPSDDTFKKPIDFFENCINNMNFRINNYSDILIQSEFVEKVKGEKGNGGT